MTLLKKIPGTVLVLLGALCLSFGGIIVKSFEGANLWQILFWRQTFFSKEYKISNLTDRMGMRLEGTVMKNIVNTNIRSEGITKGAIQVPADGQPIILLTDYPTIGGYPKIANVTSVDYNLLIQKTPGEKIFFELIKLREAEQLYKELLNSISEIIKNIKEIN